MNQFNRWGRIASLLVLSIFVGLAQSSQSIPASAITVDKLMSVYAPPAPYVPGKASCFDSKCFTGAAGDDYIKGLNRDFLGTYAVNVPNSIAQNQYNFAAQQWVAAGKNPATIPTPPRAVVFGNTYGYYVKLDLAKFDAAWAAYTAQVTRCYTHEDDGKPCDSPGVVLQSAVVVADIPTLVTVGADPAPLPPSQSPIGAANGDVFQSSDGDSDVRFPNGSVYQDASGKYIKTIFNTPFGANGKSRFWQKVQ